MMHQEMLQTCMTTNVSLECVELCNFESKLSVHVSFTMHLCHVGSYCHVVIEMASREGEGESSTLGL